MEVIDYSLLDAAALVKQSEAQEGSNLRRHPVTEIQDGDVVVVGSLVQTQISLQGVLQLMNEENRHAGD